MDMHNLKRGGLGPAGFLFSEPDNQQWPSDIAAPQICFCKVLGLPACALSQLLKRVAAPVLCAPPLQASF